MINYVKDKDKKKTVRTVWHGFKSLRINGAMLRNQNSVGLFSSSGCELQDQGLQDRKRNTDNQDRVSVSSFRVYR